MEVTNKNAALLCNHEVLKVLNEYSNEQKGNKRNDQNLSTITYETIKYLNETPAGIQTSETIESALKALSKYGLTKAEKLQLINLAPMKTVEMYSIIEENEERLSEDQVEEILDIISQHFAVEEEEAEGEEEGEVEEEEEEMEEEIEGNEQMD